MASCDQLLLVFFATLTGICGICSATTPGQDATVTLGGKFIGHISLPAAGPDRPVYPAAADDDGTPDVYGLGMQDGLGVVVGGIQPGDQLADGGSDADSYGGNRAPFNPSYPLLYGGESQLPGGPPSGAEPAAPAADAQMWEPEARRRGFPNRRRGGRAGKRKGDSSGGNGGGGYRGHRDQKALNDTPGGYRGSVPPARVPRLPKDFVASPWPTPSHKRPRPQGAMHHNRDVYRKEANNNKNHNNNGYDSYREAYRRPAEHNGGGGHNGGYSGGHSGGAYQPITGGSGHRRDGRWPVAGGHQRPRGTNRPPPANNGYDDSDNGYASTDGGNMRRPPRVVAAGSGSGGQRRPSRARFDDDRAGPLSDVDTVVRIDRRPAAGDAGRREAFTNPNQIASGELEQLPPVRRPHPPPYTRPAAVAPLGPPATKEGSASGVPPQPAPLPSPPSEVEVSWLNPVPSDASGGDDHHHDRDDYGGLPPATTTTTTTRRPPFSVVREPRAETEGFGGAKRRPSRRPAIVPVTVDGPPRTVEDLEKELLAGLSSDKLEELANSAIDPREKKNEQKKNKGAVIFPEDDD